MISTMKKVKLIVLKEDLDSVIKSIQKSGCLMIDEQENSANNNISFDGVINRADNSIKTLKKYVPKTKVFGDYLEVMLEDIENVDDQTIEIINDVENSIQQLTLNKTEIKNVRDEIKSLEPFINLNIPLDKLVDSIHTKIHYGFIIKKFQEKFVTSLEQCQSYYEILNPFKNQIAVCFINYISDDSKLMDEIKSYGFVDFNLPVFNGFVEEYITSLEEKIEDIERINENIENNLVEYSEKLPKLKLYVDSLLNKKARDESDFSATCSVNVIDGWVPESKVDNLIKAIEIVTDYYDIELSDPKENDNVPTYTINNKMVSQFEGITNMFSVPSWKELDPNPVMSIWYIILFGMMMGDVGYGIILFIGTCLFIKLLRPRAGTLNLARVLQYSSFTTLLWGIVFNSYFGFSLPFYKGIKPMEEAQTMLILSIAVGALHIVTGIIMKAIKDIKNHDYFEMLGKDLSWFLIFVGLGCFASSMLFNFSVLKNIGIWVAIIGVGLIILFAGHKKKNIFSKGLSGILGLYDVTSYMSDLLSYSRIMALVMSSAAVASVMNILAAKVSDGKGIIGIIAAGIIFVVGHLFNMVLGLLSAYVHDCRLQYIELYGKFFDGGGYEFKPLRYKTKYVNEIKINK